ncbi:class I SAM-dependent methyltransferase [Lacrimispora sp. NSJ-141]|uniref:Class I SAM-dependent methyltransferase n=1 Tax=Lientehia hominis TaxID=2897778 RepID=A0AAP2W6Z3_9FIRM|nr:class I SAM-dependent methyltransferase [Lientehia hominis]MCD2491833.1 class I SAM-dependent methyltransferase [Lientehia hominis]
MNNKEAVIVGKRWSYCAEGYDSIIQEEFEGEQPSRWSRLLRENAPKTCGKALDIGTGPGFFAVLLSRMGWEVTGIDCAEEMVRTAAKNAEVLGLKAGFYQMDNHHLNYPDNTFDYIVSRNVTWILYDPEEAFKEWFRVLKPGGRILYFDANWPYSESKSFLEAQKRDEEAYRKLYGEPANTYQGDEETEEKFKSLLYFDKVWRPEWDERYLPNCGYCNVRVIPRVNEEVYSESKQLLYRSTPMFLVTADKPLDR